MSLPVAYPDTVVANDIRIVNVSRRDLLKGAVALTLAIQLPEIVEAAGNPISAQKFEPNAFVRIGSDNLVTVISKHLEMGQGTYTGLATLVADELDADWAQVRVEGAPADKARYKNLKFGSQGTGGSNSIANSFEQYRMAGAVAKAMLIAAAARQWNVSPAGIRVQRGRLSDEGSGKVATFGEFVALASTLPVPEGVALKTPRDFVYIGKAVPRIDAGEKVGGTAKYTQDVQLPDMLVAVVAHPRRFGAKVRGVDASRARAIKGVVDVVPFTTPARCGVAVLARDFWTAKRGRDALNIDWDESSANRVSSETLLKEYQTLAGRPGAVARNDGDVAAQFKTAHRIVQANYQVPFLAHAAMEPMNCVVQLHADGCEIWNGVQNQNSDQQAVAALLGVPAERVKINMLYAGGGFGRRATPPADYVVEAVAIAAAAKTAAPVKMVWTREDDMQAGFYRPMYLHAFKAALDDKGRILAWRHRIVGQSIFSNPQMSFIVRNGVDPSSVESAADLPYSIDSVRVELHSPTSQIPVLWWRSVGASHNAFATESFLDELAHAGGKDPLALRLALLLPQSRHRGVLELVAEKAGWDKPPAKNHARGIAVNKAFGSYCAQVVEVSGSPKAIQIDRVVCAIDCGVAVNPNVIAMQMESGIAYGLSAALSGAITFEDGQVQQSNFHDYPVLRINQMPRIEVHIVPSRESPTGVGELGVPPIAPALANALRALGSAPVRTLPLSASGLELAVRQRV